jgi:glyoxylase-like metal-dependent hydrolase (beta-lactamase superfamily II)
MDIGKFAVEQLSEGFFELFEDGTFQKMDPDRIKHASEDPTLGKYSSALGIDPLLISDGETNIVVDPGLGWGLDHKSSYENTSNVVTNLNIFGLRPQDIHHVVLSHLHFDHAAGSTFVSEEFKTTATFPNAVYYVHRNEWEFALQQLESKSPLLGADYKLDELYKLIAEKRIQFIETDLFDLIPGITLMKTAGHTGGHMILKIEDDGKYAYYMGDLIPTEYHLNQYSLKQIDHDAIQSKKAKTILLRQAYKEKAYMFFYHSLFKKAGQLSLDEHKNYVLVDVS